MFNPLLKDPAGYTDAELAERITELNKKLTISARTGNHSLMQQLQVVVNQLVDEQIARQRRLIQQQNQDKDDKWKDSIDIS